jgi:hypothetical protein
MTTVAPALLPVAASVPAPTDLTPRASEDNDFSRAWGPGDFPAPAQLVNCRVKCHQDVPRHIWGLFQALGMMILLLLFFNTVPVVK